MYIKKNIHIEQCPFHILKSNLGLGFVIFILVLTDVRRNYWILNHGRYRAPELSELSSLGRSVFPMVTSSEEL